MQFGALLSKAASYTGHLLPLALVPLAASLARWDDVLAVVNRSGHHYNLKFGLPHPLADLWTFIDAPSPGEGFYIDAPFGLDGGLSVGLAALTVGFVIVTGLLLAGYVGSIDQFLRDGHFDFLKNVRTYGLRMVGFQAVVYAGLLAVIAVALVEVTLVLLSIPVAVVLWILFFLTPYLVVVENRGLLEAFRRSPRLVTTGTDPLVFVLVYGASVGVGSLPLSALMNAGLVGVLVGAGVAGIAGLFLTVFSVLFTRELVGDREEPPTAPDATPV